MEQIKEKDPKPVMLLVGEGIDFQIIGSCILEKIQGLDNNIEQQASSINVDLFHHQSANESYIRICKVEADNDQNKDKEKCVAQNISLTHANVCPQFIWSRQKNEPLTRRNGAAACGLIIDNKGYVLLTKRHSQMRTYPKCWVFPGGQVDQGESIQTTVFREIQEEVGLTFTKDINLLSKTSILIKQDPRVLMLYESVFPTLLSLGHPTRSSLVVFYVIQMEEAHEKIDLRLSSDEIECCVWVPFDLLSYLVQNDHNDDKKQMINGISANNEQIQLSIESLAGIFPNSLGEGIGEAHQKAIQAFIKDRNETK